MMLGLPITIHFSTKTNSDGTHTIDIQPTIQKSKFSAKFQFLEDTDIISMFQKKKVKFL